MALQDARTVQEAIAAFIAAGSPVKAELIRRLDETATFAVLVDHLPHAIEAGSAERVIAMLKLWGSWHDLYPVDRAIQAMAATVAPLRGSVANSGEEEQHQTAGQPAVQAPAPAPQRGWDF